jgi:hypothetical protein
MSGTSHWRMVHAPFAIYPGPAVAAVKVRKPRTWPRRLLFGMRTAATSQPPRHGSGIEVGGLAAHGTNVERWRQIPRRCGPWWPRSDGPTAGLAVFGIGDILDVLARGGGARYETCFTTAS